MDETIDEKVEFSEVNESGVEQIILHLKDVGAGTDGLNSKLLKKTYACILSKLTFFINLCLRTGTFPKLLKAAAAYIQGR